MFPFNATVPDVSPSLPRRRVADFYGHMETRLYREYREIMLQVPLTEITSFLNNFVRGTFLLPEISLAFDKALSFSRRVHQRFVKIPLYWRNPYALSNEWNAPRFSNSYETTEFSNVLVFWTKVEFLTKSLKYIFSKAHSKRCFKHKIDIQRNTLLLNVSAKAFISINLL